MLGIERVRVARPSGRQRARGLRMQPCGTPAHAGVIENLYGALSAVNGQQAATVTLLLSLISFLVLAVIVLMHTRKGAIAAKVLAHEESAALRAEIDRLKTLLLSEPKVLVSWAAGGEDPEIFGDTSIVVPGALPERVLAFGSWLDPAAAQRMESAVDILRYEGRGFVMTLTTSAGRPLEADGRAVAGRAVLRLRDVSGIESELMDLAARHDGLMGDLEIMKTLLNSLPTPVWARDHDGRLILVNDAYARAVEAENATDAVTRELELLDLGGREALKARGGAGGYARLPVIVAGQRRVLDVMDTPSGPGGIAIDVTEMDTMRAEFARMMEAHRRVLDQLATGVAIFNVDRKLIFYNTAFRSLFELDAAMLDQTPTDSAVLETLRASRNLPEEQDFRQWKQQLYEAYRAVDPKEHMWHLPDGRALRVVTAPNPEGGVTYLYDDVTERLDLHRRYDALIKVQRETLDHLAEAVAVFGSDGRVRLQPRHGCARRCRSALRRRRAADWTARPPTSAAPTCSRRRLRTRAGPATRGTAPGAGRRELDRASCASYHHVWTRTPLWQAARWSHRGSTQEDQSRGAARPIPRQSGSTPVRDGSTRPRLSSRGRPMPTRPRALSPYLLPYPNPYGVL